MRLHLKYAITADETYPTDSSNTEKNRFQGHLPLMVMDGGTTGPLILGLFCAC